MINPIPSSRPLLLRLRRRRRERGAAVFVVVMVITLLLGIGVLAARSATLGTAASGHERQMTQTHYMTEYAMLLAVAKLTPDKSGKNSPESYIKIATDQSSGNVGKCMAQSTLARPTCYPLGYEEIQKEFTPAGYSIVNPYGLGSPTIEGFFWVELTDMSSVAPAPPGHDANPPKGAGVKFYDVTATAIAQVRTKSLVPQAPGSPLDATQVGTQSTELSRAFLRVGPI